MKAINAPLVAWLLVVLTAPGVVCAAQQVGPQGSPGGQGDPPLPASVRRPYRGIFGAPPDPSSKQALTVTGSVFGAYDDDVFASEAGASTAFLGGGNRSGYYAGASAGLDYSRSGERASLGVSGNVGVNHYIEQDRTSPIYSTSANLGVKLARRTTLNTSASLVYAPQYRLGLFFSPVSFTGAADPFTSVAPDYDLFSLAAYRTSGTVSLGQSIGRRSSLEGSYSISNVNYVNLDRDYRSQTGGARFNHPLTHNLGMHVGYFYSVADYAGNSTLGPRHLHNIDVGVDYGRALSFSRRTRFTFGTGSSIIAGDTGYSSGNSNYSYRLTGNAALTHEMGRSWTAQLAYRRGVDFREGFYAPFLSDGVNASLGGLISRRLRFSSSIDYTVGTVGVGTSNDFHSQSATAGLEYGLSRTLALFGRYVYYAYDFHSQVALDQRLPRTLDRQGVRVGLTMSLPVIR